jgi:hypothetical protein
MKLRISTHSGVHHFDVRWDCCVALQNLSKPKAMEHRSNEALEKHPFKSLSICHSGDLECVKGETFEV